MIKSYCYPCLVATSLCLAPFGRASAQQFVPSAPTQVSVGANSTGPDNQSGHSVVSPNAKLVVFTSSATNLVSGDTNKATDIFVRGANGVIERLSVSGSGIEGDADSMNPSLSQSEPDGSYAVAFVSRASTFFQGSSQAFTQVYLRIPHIKKTILISRGYDGSPSELGIGNSGGPSVVSLKGGTKYLVAFHSNATNLVKDAVPPPAPGANGPPQRIFFATFTVATGVVEMKAFIGANGIQADGDLLSPALNGRGDRLVFMTDASNMGWINPQKIMQVAVAHKATQAVELVSKSPEDGAAGIDTSDLPSISFNGSRIAFKTTASNILNSSNASPGLIAYSVDTKISVRINSDQLGNSANLSRAESARLDPRGRLAVFIDDGDNHLFPAGTDTNQREDVFVRDLDTLQVIRVNLDANGGQEMDGQTTDVWMGGLGFNSQTATVSFTSSSSNLRQFGDVLNPNVFRVSLTFPPPRLESSTKIETPPDIKPSPRTLKLTLQEFDGSDITPGITSVGPLATKLTYDIRITNTTTKRQKKVTSTKNRVTLRRLSPGTYSVKYRVKGTADTGSKVTTKFSPAVEVTVTKR